MPLKQSLEPVTEPYGVQTIFADGLCAAMTVGAVTHLIFTVRQSSVHEPRMERVVQARLIVPTEQLQAIGRAILAGQTKSLLHGDCAGEERELH
jgi:hypothetical protein